ncbi:hypothetical protein [Roseateles sp.]|uniref:hypothetical protein n=1 Tax=Roseateles sp. TaxID=1971397 RepID=UPI003D0BA59C
MLEEWTSMFAPAAQDRMILLLNHVISREALAMARLQPFAGQSVLLHLQNWPTLLPQAPDLALGVTPAGLFERLEQAPEGALRIDIDASNPALLALASFTGQKPQVSVQGDAAFAGAMNWLIENLRWDIEDDLAALLGPVAAHQLARWGRAIATALGGLAAGARGAMAAAGRGSA